MLMMDVTQSRTIHLLTLRVATIPIRSRQVFDAVLRMARSAPPLEHALEGQHIPTQRRNAQMMERGFAPKMNCVVKSAVLQEEIVIALKFGLLPPRGLVMFYKIYLF